MAPQRSVQAIALLLVAGFDCFFEQRQALRPHLLTLRLSLSERKFFAQGFDALAETEVDPQRAAQAGTFDRLADNLGALSFLIDMLSVQPHLAKSLFRFDPVEGSLSAVMGQSDRASTFGGLDALAAGIVHGTAGNMSIRDPESGLIAISPSGIPYPEVTPADVVIVTEDAEVVDGRRKPSSETPLHTSLILSGRSQRTFQKSSNRPNQAS